MIALLLFIIAIILFFIAKSLHNQADRMDNSVSYQSTNTKPIIVQPRDQEIQQPIVTKLTYWESWKKNNPFKAKAIEKQLDRDLSKMSDSDVKQIISAFGRLSNSNNNPDWSQVKEDTLSMLIGMVDSFGKDKAMTMLENGMFEEMSNFQIKKENTSLYISITWLNEALENSIKEDKPLSLASQKTNNNSYMNTPNKQEREYSEEEKKAIVDQFKQEYISQIMTTIGDNIKIPFFSKGYDSPVAREIMNIMYSYLRNNEFINKAKRDGLWTKLMFLIIEETNNITDKYCDADVQECIEFYNFPEKPVITSRRCPGCGSRKVFCEDIGQYECMSCGCSWNAYHGRNTYSPS